MDVLKRIHELQDLYGWSSYKLSKKAGLSEGTISNMYKRNTIPNLFTLQSICNAFNITLSQFFFDEDTDKHIRQLTPDLENLIDNWGENYQSKIKNWC